MALALLLSLLARALLLSLTFGGQGFGLRGLTFPWQERRIQAPDLHIVLVPAPPAAPPVPVVAPAAQPAAARPPPPVAPQVPTPRRKAAKVVPKVAAKAVPKIAAKAVTAPKPEATTSAAPSRPRLHEESPGDPAPPPTAAPIDIPALSALTQADDALWAVPAAVPKMPTPAFAAASSCTSRSGTG